MASEARRLIRAEGMDGVAAFGAGKAEESFWADFAGADFGCADADLDWAGLD